MFCRQWDIRAVKWRCGLHGITVDVWSQRGWNIHNSGVWSYATDTWRADEAAATTTGDIADWCTSCHCLAGDDDDDDAAAADGDDDDAAAADGDGDDAAAADGDDDAAAADGDDDDGDDGDGDGDDDD